MLETTPHESSPPAAWLEAANHLATVVAQVSSTLHGLNNVLQVIAGNAEMLETTEGVPDGALRRAQVIGVQALRASALLAEVLTMSRVAASGIVRVDLRDIAEVALTVEGVEAIAAGKTAKGEVVADMITNMIATIGERSRGPTIGMKRRKTATNGLTVSSRNVRTRLIQMLYGRRTHDDRIQAMISRV